MSVLAQLAAAFAFAALVVHLLSCGLALMRCTPWKRRTTASRPPLPPVSLIRPVCGLEHAAEATLGSSFTLDHPDYELIFCVADERDVAVPLLESLRLANPHVPCRILFGRDNFPANPKLDNCAKGWAAARHDQVVMADSNLLLPADYLTRVLAGNTAGVGLVSAPPIGADPQGFWAEVECAVLNTYQARVQYAVDTLGLGFAQGKTLAVRRSVLDKAGSYAVLGCEPAEDAAATKAIRSIGLSVRLAMPPFVQPLGRRSWRAVWSRQLRWARLRRATFPVLFVPEILSGGLAPILAALYAAGASDLPLVPFATAWLVVWYGSEAVLAAAARWRLHWTSPAAWLVRDLAIPAVWVGAFCGRRFEWRGAILSVDGETARG